MSDDHKTQIVSGQPVVATLEARPELHPLVADALPSIVQSGAAPDLAMIEKLMDLQDRYEQGKARKAYTRAMTRLKAALPKVIAHDKLVDFETGRSRTRYTHASLAALVEQTVGILSDHGFSHSWIPATPEPNTVVVTCRLTHVEGHSEEVTVASNPDTKGGKNAPQAIASTITFLKRHTLAALLGLATADMNELMSGEKEVDAVVNPKRNMGAVKKLSEVGVTRADAEAHVGKPMEEWTGAEIALLVELHRSMKAAKAEEA
jgi:hypothetical protein